MTPTALLGWIDRQLNRFTMYQVVLYALLIELAAGIIAAFTGLTGFSGWGIILTMLVVAPVGFIANQVLSRLYRVPLNHESYMITGIILTLILPQTSSVHTAIAVGLASLLAAVSKFVLAFHRHHIFNPAAFGATVIGLLGLGYATWWIGNPTLAPLTIVLGLLVIRKIRRFGLVTVYAIVSIAASIVAALSTGASVGDNLHALLLSSPFIFLGTIMLTEPSTMPRSRIYRFNFALIVGVLASSQLHYGSFTVTAQVALLVGNLFAFIVEPQSKTFLRLIKRRQLTPTAYDFEFESTEPLRFRAGQYMEWTLPHSKVDRRGNRRSFSIASAPSDDHIHLGIRVAPEKGSSFKRALTELKPGDTILAGQVSGEFTLPYDETTKLVWIAGGIGITPFRSMAAEATSTNMQRQTTLYYLVRSRDEAVYGDVFSAAAKTGLTTHLLVDERLTAERLKDDAIDLRSTRFYLAGPDGMVRAYVRLLNSLGVPRINIVTDYFAGY